MGVLAQQVVTDQQAFVIGLVIVILFSWAIGMLPVVVVRHFVMGRPISKRAANWTAGVISGLIWFADVALTAGMGNGATASTLFPILLFFANRSILYKGHDREAASPILCAMCGDAICGPDQKPAYHYHGEPVCAACHVHIMEVEGRYAEAKGEE